MNLTDLYLQDNMIAELPDSFGECVTSSLHHYLSLLLLIGMLQKLVTCRLDTNRLTKLPESIGG